MARDNAVREEAAGMADSVARISKADSAAMVKNRVRAEDKARESPRDSAVKAKTAQTVVTTPEIIMQALQAEVIDKINHVRCVVMETAASFTFLGTPCRSFSLEHYRPVCFTKEVVNVTDSSTSNYLPGLTECRNKPIVESHLIHQTLFGCQFDHLSAFINAQTKRLFYKDVYTSFHAVGDDSCM